MTPFTNVSDNFSCVCVCAVKMHPPGVPEVTATANGTLISWSAGSPVSEFIESFLFHVQIKEESQAWTVSIEWAFYHLHPFIMNFE